MPQPQKIADIGQVVHEALVLDFKNQQFHKQLQRNSMDSLLAEVVELFELLHARDVSYLLVGGIALLQYVEGRNTRDVDLIVALEDVQKIPDLRITSQDDDFAQGFYKSLPVDFLLTRNALFDTVKRHYTNMRPFLERQIPSASIEGLLLLKLYALPALYRTGNFARVSLYENDIATLIEAHHPRLEPLFDELSKHLRASDLRLVREIVDEITQRIERFDQKQQ